MASAITIFMTIFIFWSLGYILPKELPPGCEYHGEMGPITDFRGDSLAAIKVILRVFFDGLIIKNAN